MLTQYSKKEGDCQVVVFFLREKSESFSFRSAKESGVFFLACRRNFRSEKTVVRPCTEFHSGGVLPSPDREKSRRKKCVRGCRCEISEKNTPPLPDREKPRRKKCVRGCRCEISEKNTLPLPDREKSRRKKCARGCRCEISEEEEHPRATGKSHKCERKIPFSLSRRFLSKGGELCRFGVKTVQNDKKSVHFFKCTLFSDRFFLSVYAALLSSERSEGSCRGFEKREVMLGKIRDKTPSGRSDIRSAQAGRR